MSENDLNVLHAQMKESIEDQVVKLIKFIFVRVASENCECRKPNPGMIQKAVKDFPIDIIKNLIVWEF